MKISWFCKHCVNSKFNSLWPCDAIWWHSSGSVLTYVMAYWLMAKNIEIIDLELNQFWFVISYLQWHSPESNFIASNQTIILYDEFKDYDFKIVATSPRGQWVNEDLYFALSHSYYMQLSDMGENCIISRADFMLAPSQWETSLQSNAVSHWLGANLESALHISFMLQSTLSNMGQYYNHSSFRV